MIEHIAIIMDGNGRYATKKGQLRTFGHKKGVEKVREIAIYCNKLGIKALTLYAFSTENWKRPENEINFIMGLPKIFFNAYLKELMKNNIKIKMIGKLEQIPLEARNIFLNAIEETKNNTGLILNFALNYGSKDEIVRACRKYAEDVKNGRNNDLDEVEFEHYLDTANLPKIDLLIRTSGEKRLSNFLLYQLAYSEFIFIDAHWPEFSNELLDQCLLEYQNRKRRFGGI